MALAKIKTLDELHGYLHAAMQLEHATIPPYLTALYSIHPGANSDAFHLIRVVVVEEMLHLTLSANILNAVGGRPDLTAPGFVPTYPTALPDGEEDFQVSLQGFSKDAIDTFLKIERPADSRPEEDRMVRRERAEGSLPAVNPQSDADLHFYSIGEFYHEIERGLEYLQGEMAKQGKELFAGDPALQVTPEYYYSGGGELIAVKDLGSAKAAIRLISEQGEGFRGGIYDYEDELSHYYRFDQLLKGRYYREGDKAHEPTGAPLDVDWGAVYPVVRNARLDMYPEGSELRAFAEGFNAEYQAFLGLITEAFTGRPELLIQAVGDMFRLKEMATAILRNPIPGKDGVNAAPTFEMAGV